MRSKVEPRIAAFYLEEAHVRERHKPAIFAIFHKNAIGKPEKTFARRGFGCLLRQMLAGTFEGLREPLWLYGLKKIVESAALEGFLWCDSALEYRCSFRPECTSSLAERRCCHAPQPVPERHDAGQQPAARFSGNGRHLRRDFV